MYRTGRLWVRDRKDPNAIWLRDRYSPRDAASVARDLLPEGPYSEYHYKITWSNIPPKERSDLLADLVSDYGYKVLVDGVDNEMMILSW